MQAIPWHDYATNTKERTIYTAPQLGIQGLRMFGHHCANHAIPALPLHYHENSFEFTYIAKGNLRFAVNDQSVQMSGGDLMLTFPNEAHDTGSIPMSLHKMYWFQLETETAESLFDLNQEATRDLCAQLHMLSTHIIKMDEQASTQTLETVFKLLAMPDALSHRQAGTLLLFFIYRVIANAQRVDFRLTPDIGRAANYALDHLQENLSLETLAQVSLLSVSRFKQKFKAQMGTSPREFINFQKIEMAKTILLENHNVTETAMQLGFSSSDYFATVFRHFTNYSPTQYIALSENKQLE
ncbi:MAG: AraC family transcriptional regulator [Ruthenibacterium sp.]